MSFFIENYIDMCYDFFKMFIEVNDMESSVMKYSNVCNSIMEEVNKVIIGKPESVRLLILSLISGGHVLIDDVPGVGKTTIAAALSKAVGLDYKRVQLTPDVMASDISGFSVFDKTKGDFSYKPGVVFTNVLIADEINRTSPKTQSALLEAMEEKQVTVDGVTRKLPKPFMVIATENPVGFIGTYPLPEAQLDRFLIKFTIGYPSLESEIKIIADRKKENPLNFVSAVASVDDIIEIQNAVSEIYVDELICKYITELVQATRINKNVILAASPRASIALLKASSANALMNGRNYVIPKDVSDLYQFVVGHRIVLSAEAKLERMTNYDVLEEIKNTIKAPILKK